ncbi:Thiazole synthase [Candidatus Providencia siddallii]|uniref:Thiazole synthase n=1 Tax=Candidatus Providencia siddallii TaxID=1715285 RepID=A0A0M6WAC0_9GAMM|nr:Thiazole synthase [Candidatus Providencia siddallii]
MLKIANVTFQSRLFIGTGKFASFNIMEEAILASGSQLVTVAIKRINFRKKTDDILCPLQKIGVNLLPNTSGAKNAREAVIASCLSREALNTNWIKLEIHPDTRYLLPDSSETLLAAEQLVKKGFVVLPYCNADPVLCKRLEEVGCSAVMPLGAPIGTNKGLITKEMLRIIIEQSNVPVVIDAGIGVPSHAAESIEIGADAVLINTAIATAKKPIVMAKAFKLAIEAAELACNSGISVRKEQAEASSQLTNFLGILYES